MKKNMNITNLDEFKEQSKAVELAAEKLQEELTKLNAIYLKINVSHP
jgi:predicted translin family RNA/ssDNA-binding protein